VKAWHTAAVLVALTAGLAACGSTTPPAQSSAPAASSDTSAVAAPTSTAAPAPTGTHQTIADYIKANQITESRVKRGDPGSPTVTLPVPAGWRDAAAQTPQFAYWAAVLDDPAVAADPATVIALMSKLTGPVDAAKIFEFAPGELNNLPGYDGAADGTKSTLGGFDAVQLGGSYVKDGMKRMIAQKTVVIPATDGSGLYVLQLNANGLEDQMGRLLDAVSTIDANTTITP
jgi:hypothetical protein